MRGEITDLLNRHFGRWHVLSFAGQINRRASWLCRCDCGIERIVLAQSLLSGQSISCGCLAIERARESTHTHGLNNRNSRAHRIWNGIKQRCLNPKNKRYADYGGRGIAVCDRWLSFENFLADMGEPSEGLTLDRKENDKGYSPENCRWATSYEQQNNMRSNRFIKFNGKQLTLAQWEREKGFKPSTLSTRLRRGWSIERALTELV